MLLAGIVESIKNLREKEMVNRCPHYKRGKRGDSTCLKTNKRIDKKNSTMCRKSHKKCKLMIKETVLEDFYKEF